MKHCFEDMDVTLNRWRDRREEARQEFKIEMGSVVTENVRPVVRMFDARWEHYTTLVLPDDTQLIFRRYHPDGEQYDELLLFASHRGRVSAFTAHVCLLDPRTGSRTLREGARGYGKASARDPLLALCTATLDAADPSRYKERWNIK